MKSTRLALFVLLFVSYAYFYQAGGWNQNSRFDLVRAITNEHSLRIDPFEANTGDKAVFAGHYYSDKAPGVAFAATPAVWIARLIVHLFGGDPESYGGIAFLSYLATVVTSGLFTALAAVVLYDVCRALGFSSAASLFAALTYGLASPMWPLATLFLGHAISAACLVFAYAAAVSVWGSGRPKGLRYDYDRSQSAGGETDGNDADARDAIVDDGAAIPRSMHIHDTYIVMKAAPRDALLGLAVGVGGGWATVSEFPAAIPAALIAALAALHAARLGRERLVRVVVALTAGALACAAVLMVYQYACFGSPFHVAYTSEQGFEAMQQGFFGVSAPKWVRLRRILFEEYRGLLPLAPALALAPFGLVALVVRDRRARPAAIVATLIAAYYVSLNAGYTYWEGGWSYGPRHLAPAIPFLAIGLAAVWTASARPIRALLAALAVVATALSFVAVSTMAQPPAEIRRPLAELLLPAFRDGDLSLNTQRFTDGGANGGALRAHVDPKAAWNLGMKAGLTGHASLVPLAIVWLASAAWLTAAARARRRWVE
jgi:hypothetical protein